MENNKTDCPQCEGIGHESMGFKSIICRRCKGVGAVEAIPKTASVLNGGSHLEKFAANEDETVEYLEEDDAFGSGVDILAAQVSTMNETMLNRSIMQLMRSMDQNQLASFFDRLFAVLKTEPTAETLLQITDEQTQQKKYYAVMEYIAEQMSHMTIEQLRQLFCEARKFT